MSTFNGQIDIANPRGWLNVGDSLADFRLRDMAFDGIAECAYVAGHGPAVIVMHGTSREVAFFARWLRNTGLSLYLRSLLRGDGAELEAAEAIT